MASGCDTATRITSAKASLISNNNLTFTGRYLNRVSGAHDELNATEGKALKNAGIFIVSLYESGSGTSLSHFTRANGSSDAADAIALASDLGQPDGTPIYFCIDLDITKAQMSTNIVPYVQGIISKLNDSSYKLGIYASKPVCKYIRGTYSATERYMMICDNDWGQSSDWSATEQNFTAWNLRQYDWNKTISNSSTSIKIDYVESSSSGGGGWMYQG